MSHQSKLRNLLPKDVAGPQDLFWDEVYFHTSSTCVEIVPDFRGVEELPTVFPRRVSLCDVYENVCLACLPSSTYPRLYAAQKALLRISILDQKKGLSRLFKENNLDREGFYAITAVTRFLKLRQVEDLWQDAPEAAALIKSYQASIQTKLRALSPSMCFLNTTATYIEEAYGSAKINFSEEVLTSPEKVCFIMEEDTFLNQSAVLYPLLWMSLDFQIESYYVFSVVEEIYTKLFATHNTLGTRAPYLRGNISRTEAELFATFFFKDRLPAEEARQTARALSSQ